MSRIKEIRDEQLLSQTFVASLLDLSIEEYQSVEKKGFSHATNEIQDDLCKLFGVEPKDLHQTLEGLTHDELKIKELEQYRLIINRSQGATNIKEETENE